MNLTKLHQPTTKANGSAKPAVGHSLSPWRSGNWAGGKACATSNQTLTPSANTATTWAVRRSSLARLNNQQPASCYEALFYKLSARCITHAPKHGFRFKNPLYALDGSLIDLSLKLFPWAHYALGKGAIKLTVGLDLRGNIPAFVAVTGSKKAGSGCAKPPALPKGSVIVCDRGYNDCGWYKSLATNGVFYATRQRSNATYGVIEQRAVATEPTVISGTIIRYNSLRPQKKQLPDIRQVVYVDAETNKDTPSSPTISGCRRRPLPTFTSSAGRPSCSSSGLSRTSRSSHSWARARMR